MSSGKPRASKLPAGLVIGAMLTCLAFAAAVFGPLLPNYDPLQMNYENSLTAPGEAHVFGTDEFGRDLFIRTLLGLRLSLMIACGAVLVAAFVGSLIGMSSGYYRGWLGQVQMRVSDVLLSFPPIVVALAIVAFWGTGAVKLAVAIGVVQIPRFARLAFGSTSSESRQEYIGAARALGSGTPRIFVRHLMPNMLAPIVVEMSLAIGTAVLTEAGLSYLGLGTPPPAPSLGRMIGTASGFLSIAPWMLLAPSGVLSITIIGLNLLGDALRDKLDPRTR